MKLILVATLFVHYIQANEDNLEITDLNEFQPIEDKVLNQLTEPDDGPFEKKIKKLLAEYLVASAVETVSNLPSEVSSRALQGGYPAQQQQQPQVVYVYGTPPPTPTTRRTRRPPNHHNHHSQESIESSEERNRNRQPSQQIIQPAYQPQYQPAPQQQPAAKPQLQQEIPVYQPSGQQPLNQQPSQNAPTSAADKNRAQLQQPVSPVTSPQQVQSSVPIVQPNPGSSQTQTPPVQVVYLPGTTPTASTGPPTTSRPRPTQQHIYNQVNRIFDNVGAGNIPGIVDSALGIRTPAPTRIFVNGILNSVFCNPINRLFGRCRGMNGKASKLN